MSRRFAVLAFVASLTALLLSRSVVAETLPSPIADAPQCGKFGIATTGVETIQLPIAKPLVMDLSVDGRFARLAGMVRATLGRDLATTGVFAVLGSSDVPVTTAVTWFSTFAMDYVGWWNAGAWMVVVAELFEAEGKPVVRLSAHLTEEGTTLLFSGSQMQADPATIEIFVHRFVNELVRCITGTPGIFGTRIVYAHRPARGQSKEIWVTEFGSNKQAQVSHDGDIALFPTWAPEGKIAWTGYKNGDLMAFVDDKVFSPDNGLNSGLAWSPDRSVVALTQSPGDNPDIYLLDGRTGTAIARLSHTAGIDTSPAWSPDGASIAFVSDRNGFPQVWVMDKDGQNARPLDLPGAYNTSPAWSPDGRLIAYQSRGKLSRFSIWVYEVDTGIARPVSRTGTNDEEPAWSPDSRLIVYTSTRQGQKRLFVMDRDGHNPRSVLDEPGEFFTPAWEGCP